MPLPDLIEILPLTTPVTAHITVPGSKSITNRALVLAALAEGRTTLTGALWSEDTYNITENGLITNDLCHSPGWGTGLRVYRTTVRNQDQRTIGKFIGQGRYCRTEKPRGKAL